MPDKYAIIQEIIKQKGWSAISNVWGMPWQQGLPCLRDKIKTMRQGAGRALNDRHWSMDPLLSVIPPSERREEREGGRRGGREEGKGQPALGFIGAAGILRTFFKALIVSSQGSNWTCYTVYLHTSNFTPLLHTKAREHHVNNWTERPVRRLPAILHSAIILPLWLQQKNNIMHTYCILLCSYCTLSLCEVSLESLCCIIFCRCQHS